MDVLGDLLIGLLGAGRRRPAGPSRPITRVQPTLWRSAGLVAVTAQVLTLVMVLVQIGRLAWFLAGDDMLFVLSIIVVPLLVAGLGLALAVLVWMVGTVRRLVALDSRARLDLAVVGTGGLLVAGWTAALGLLPAGLVIGVPATASLAVAIVPAAWRPVPGSGSALPPH